MAWQEPWQGSSFNKSTTTVRKYLYQLSNAGTVRLSQANDFLAKLGCKHLLEKRLSSLQPHEANTVRIVASLSSTRELLMFDEPFSCFDSVQRTTLALLMAQQRSKAIVVTLNSKADLDLLSPNHHYCLDDIVISN